VPGRVRIPVEPGCLYNERFSHEAILGALGGTPQPLVDPIVNGSIRGAVGIVALQQPQDQARTWAIPADQTLIENDILVVVTGCATVSGRAKWALMVRRRPTKPDQALRAVCKAWAFRRCATLGKLCG